MSGVASKIAQDRAKAEGLGSINNPVKFAGQDFQKLRAERLASGTLFKDPVFPASPDSLGYAEYGPKSDNVKRLKWMRPSAIQKTKPVFIEGGADRQDIRQGKIGNCWLLGSIASLTMNQDCLLLVVPSNQSFDEDYAGIFHFTFWQYGEWVDVVVDDLLPTLYNDLNFLKSKTANEFWSPLLEKAYAKIHGSYEALIAGFAAESLVDFTGGVGEVYATESAPKDLFQKIQTALKEKSLITSSSVFNKGKQEVTKQNMVTAHTYSVTGAEEVTFDGNVVQIIRMRNPWGYTEWNGAWSDSAPEWKKVDPKVKAKLHVKESDGEFWMPFLDFLKEYVRMEICDINLSEAYCGDNFKWCLTEFNGSWRKGSNAGGFVESSTFWINPQYRITLEAPDGDASKKCTVVVSLTQKDRRKNKLKDSNYFHIGFYIYKVQPSDKIPLGQQFFKNNNYVSGYLNYFADRDISHRFELLPGDYVIVVATYEASQEADFYLRVFTEKPMGAQEAGGRVKANIFEPVITSETDSQFEIVKDELQKGEFNENEVKDLLKKMLAKYPEIKSDGFSMETTRQLIKLMDLDNTGTLSTKEFKNAWLKVENYMKFFQSSDTDKSGTISAPELRNALTEAGFNVNDQTLSATINRLVNENQTLDLDAFIYSATRLETSFKMFNILDPNQSGVINLSLTEWLDTLLA